MVYYGLLSAFFVRFRAFSGADRAGHRRDCRVAVRSLCFGKNDKSEFWNERPSIDVY